MKNLILVVFAFILFSCSNDQPVNIEENESNVPVVFRNMESEVHKTIARLSIGGMTCAEGCGGKIQKELQELAGVIKTDLDYSDSRTSNIVSVEYVPGNLSEQQLISCVHSIMDGAYKVDSVEVITYKGLQSRDM